MARVSRKQIRNVSNELDNIEYNIYYAAIYLRLSGKELETDESNKIENQKKVLLNFISKKENIILQKIYCDNGTTGTNFERIEWTRLMTDIKSGNINCVIVKDFSRLGRNYLETENYLNNIFPQLNVRFISVNDNYDTCDVEKSCSYINDIVVPLKNILNDELAKDISEKIFSAKETLRKEGKFTGNVAPYGYKKDENNKHHLVINNETSPTIRRIFELKLDKKTNTEICKILNSENIPSPYKYLYDKGKVTSKRYANNIWQNATIKVITENQMYVGDMVQGKKQKYLAGGMLKIQKLDKSDYIIVRNTHKPIIDRNTFLKVQKICQEELKLNRKKRNSYSNIRKTEDILYGYIFNKNGEKLYRTRSMRKKHKVITYYYTNHSNVNASYHISISEIYLKEILRKLINLYIKLFFELQEFLNIESVKEKINNRILKFDKQLQLIKKEKDSYFQKMPSLYEDLSKGILNEKEYLFQKNINLEKYKVSCLKFDKLTKKKKDIQMQFSDKNIFIQKFKTMSNIENINDITKEMVKLLVDKIIIYNNKDVEIIFLFQNELKNIIKFYKGGCCYGHK